jgi:hypothetical protein
MSNSPRSLARTAATLTAALLGALGLGALGLGCVLYVDDTECGPFAYDYRGACYCEDGYEGDDPRGYGCSPVMSWRITDDCNDGADVAWKLFSDDRDWTWPAGNAVYLTPGLGYDGVETIVCEVGELICFGAETETGRVYGVGLDFAQGCNDCCYSCSSREIDIGYLTCQ